MLHLPQIQRWKAALTASLSVSTVQESRNGSLVLWFVCHLKADQLGPCSFAPGFTGLQSRPGPAGAAIVPEALHPSALAVGRIQFLVDQGWRSPFSCWLTAEYYSQLLEATLRPLPHRRQLAARLLVSSRPAEDAVSFQIHPSDLKKGPVPVVRARPIKSGPPGPSPFG